MAAHLLHKGRWLCVSLSRARPSKSASLTTNLPCHMAAVWATTPQNRPFFVSQPSIAQRGGGLDTATPAATPAATLAAAAADEIYC